MGVGIQVGEEVREIGTASFLHAFFSTVSYRLEPAGWGTRFPTLINRLYQGKVPPSHVEGAVTELAKVRKELERFPPSAVVWDIDNLSVRPPWGDNIAPEITNLACYFVTSDGKDLLKLLTETVADASRRGLPVMLVSC